MNALFGMASLVFTVSLLTGCNTTGSGSECTAQGEGNTVICEKDASASPAPTVTITLAGGETSHTPEPEPEPEEEPETETPVPTPSTRTPVQDAPTPAARAPFTAKIINRYAEVHTSPDKRSPIVQTLPPWASVRIHCTVVSYTVLRDDGVSSSLWNKIDGGYVPDVLVYTGTDAAVMPPC